MTALTPLNLDQIRRNVTELATTHPQIVADVSALLAEVRHLRTELAELEDERHESFVIGMEAASTAVNVARENGQLSRDIAELRTANDRLRIEAANGELWRLAAEAVEWEEAR